MAKRDQFAEARAVLKSQEVEAKRLERLLKVKADWDDPHDVSTYKNVARARERESTLASIVGSSRLCPRCGRGPLLESRQWVINVRKKAAICRVCFAGGAPSLAVNVRVDIFGALQPRWPLDGYKLARARERIGMSLSRFAIKMGWSRAYQRNVEEGNVSTVNEETAKQILQVFTEAGADIAWPRFADQRAEVRRLIVAALEDADCMCAEGLDHGDCQRCKALAMARVLE